jgi:hypothetical protein
MVILTYPKLRSGSLVVGVFACVHILVCILLGLAVYLTYFCLNSMQNITSNSL